MTDAADLIDSDRYPIHNLDSPSAQQLVAQCRQALSDNALCCLPGFLRPEAITQITEQCAPLAKVAHYYNGPRGSYPVSEDRDGESGWSESHPRHTTHMNRYRQVLNHQIANDSTLRRLYYWPVLTEFVRLVFGADEMYRSQCPHLSLTLKVAGEGDTDGWHYDPNDGVVSLLLQEPDCGGHFEYAPYIRTETDQCYDAVGELFAEPERVAQRLSFKAGTFVFFNGRRSLHRVSPVGPTRQPRTIALLSYDRRPDQMSSQSYIDRLRSYPTDADTEILANA